MSDERCHNCGLDNQDHDVAACFETLRARISALETLARAAIEMRLSLMLTTNDAPERFRVLERFDAAVKGAGL